MTGSQAHRCRCACLSSTQEAMLLHFGLAREICVEAQKSIRAHSEVFGRA